MPIAADVVLGLDVRIFQPDLVNLYGCSIGAETRIGAFVEIQKNAIIGARCKISSHSFVCEGVIIEALQTEADWQVIKTTVKRRAGIGSNATIIAGVTIGESALIGAGSVVTRDVADYAIVAGAPARVIGDMRERTTFKMTSRDQA